MYALGTFLYTRRQDSEHGASIEHTIASKLLKACDDGSVLVRKEVVVALSRYVQQYEQCFEVACKTYKEETRDVRPTRVSLCEDDDISKFSAHMQVNTLRCSISLYCAAQNMVQYTLRM